MTDKCCKTCVFFVDKGYGECRRYPEPVRWVPPMSKQKPEKHWCGEHTEEVIKGEPAVTEESFTVTTSDEGVIMMLRNMYRDQIMLPIDDRKWTAVDISIISQPTDVDGELWLQKRKGGQTATAVFKPRKDTV